MTKPPIALFAFILFATFVASCDEHDEKMETKNETIQWDVSRNRTSSGTINSSVGDPIDLATAKSWAFNYRKSHPEETLSHFFGFEIIEKILSQADCVGIRIYYGINDAGEKQLMLVGVDATGENLLPLEGARISEDGNIIGDASWPCPSTCPTVDL